MNLFNTIKNKIRLYFFLSIAAIIFTIGYFSIFQFETTLERQIQENQRQISQQLFLNIDKELHDGLDEIAVLQENKIIRTESTAKESKQAELNAFKMIFKNHETVALLDKDGELLASTDFRIGGDWRYYPFFTKALAGTSVISNAFYISDPLRLVFAISAPVKNEAGSIIGVVVSLVNADSIIAINNQSKVGQTGFSLVLDEFNKIIAAPDRAWLLTSPTELFSETNQSANLVFNGDKYFYALYESKGVVTDKIYHGSLKVYTMQKSAEIINNFKSDIYLIIAVSSVLFLIFTVLAIYLSSFLTRPIDKLKKGFEKITKGEFGKLKIETRDEMGQLLVSFNDLAEKLKASDNENKKHHQELEELVAKRTVELEEKVEEMKKFNLYATKRELKMVELKEKISKLTGVQDKNLKN